MLLSIKTYKNIEISIFIIQNIETLPKNYSSVKGRVLDIAFIYLYLLMESASYSLTWLHNHVQENNQNLLNNVFLIFPNHIRDQVLQKKSVINNESTLTQLSFQEISTLNENSCQYYIMLTYILCEYKIKLCMKSIIFLHFIDIYI